MPEYVMLKSDSGEFIELSESEATFMRLQYIQSKAVEDAQFAREFAKRNNQQQRQSRISSSERMYNLLLSIDKRMTSLEEAMEMKNRN